MVVLIYSLRQAQRARGTAGDPLPSPFKSLEANGTQFIKGQLGIISAGPGTGKSGFVLTNSLKSDPPIPSLYFSADADAFIQLSRAVAIRSGCTMETAAESVRSGLLGPFSEALSGVPTRFNFDASPSLDTIENGVEAYEEVYGVYPDKIVVDNITNVRLGGSQDDDPFSSGGLESLMDYLHTMARDTGAFVAGLHHVTGPHNNGDHPIPLDGIKGQIGRVPELILTLHKQTNEYGPDLLNVSTVKNTGGKADPTGQRFVSLEFDADRMRIADFATPWE